MTTSASGDPSGVRRSECLAWLAIQRCDVDRALLLCHGKPIAPPIRAGPNERRGPVAQLTDGSIRDPAAVSPAAARLLYQTNPPTRHTREGDSRQGALRRSPRRSLASPSTNHQAYAPQLGVGPSAAASHRLRVEAGVASRRVGGEAPVPAFRPVVSSPPPSEPDVRVPPHPALHEQIKWFWCHASACWTRSSTSCSG